MVAKKRGARDLSLPVVSGGMTDLCHPLGHGIEYLQAANQFIGAINLNSHPASAHFLHDVGEMLR
jgi:hypothetical protein